MNNFINRRFSEMMPTVKWCVPVSNPARDLCCMSPFLPPCFLPSVCYHRYQIKRHEMPKIIFKKETSLEIKLNNNWFKNDSRHLFVFSSFQLFAQQPLKKWHHHPDIVSPSKLRLLSKATVLLDNPKKINSNLHPHRRKYTLIGNKTERLQDM